MRRPSAAAGSRTSLICFWRPVLFRFIFKVYSCTRSICFLCNSVISTTVTDRILCYSGTGSDRFSRILRHMLTQRRWGPWWAVVLRLMPLVQHCWSPCFCFNFTVSTHCTHLWRMLTWIMRSSRALVECSSPPMFSSFHLNFVIL